jgi:alpha-amylase
LTPNIFGGIGPLIYFDLPDRRKETGKPQEIEAWTGFDFKGRGGMYSSMKYNWNHFTATDYDAKTQTNAIYKFLGRDKKGWSKDVDDELGNYDYLCVSQP